jgi:AcrR family transcriptional regulator
MNNGLVWFDEPAPQRGTEPLSRERIVAAAVELADEEPSGEITMRTLATRLGVRSPMALYRYVGNKDGLVDLMLDEVAGEVPVPARGPDWRADLHAAAVATRRMIGRHPWFPRLFHTRPPAGPNIMRALEFKLAVLTGAGAALPDAMTYAAMLDRHVLGTGMQEEIEGGPVDPALFAAVRALAADRDLPKLAAWLSSPSGPSVDEQFELGLRFLLDGIAARLTS